MLRVDRSLMTLGCEQYNQEVLAEYLVDMVSIRDVVCTVVAKGEVDNVLDRWSLSEESFNICR
jgi:hypothetical protein